MKLKPEFTEMEGALKFNTQDWIVRQKLYMVNQHYYSLITTLSYTVDSYREFVL